MTGLFQGDIQNPHCKHIFFGGAGREWYHKTLLSNGRFEEKITIIQGSIDSDLTLQADFQVAKFASVEFTAEEIDMHPERTTEEDSKSDNPQEPEPVSLINLHIMRSICILTSNTESHTRHLQE